MGRNLSLGQAVSRGLASVPSIFECRRRFRNWAELTRLYANPERIRPPVTAVGRAGFTLELYESSDIQTVWTVFCANSYQMPAGCQTVLDLGANIGTFSVYASFLFGAKRVIALEPVAATFQRLTATIHANHLEGVVQAIPKGIAGEVGVRTIHHGVTSVHSSMYYRGNSKFERGSEEEIQVTTLGRLLDELGIEYVDMCKLDCEGGEVEALLAASDATLGRIKRLAMEYHFPGNLSDKPTLFARLERAGFRCVWESPVGKMACFER